MKYIRFISILLVSCGLFVQFTVKDTYYWSSLIFYAFPFPVILGLIFVLLISATKRLRIWILLGLLLISAIWTNQSFRFQKKEVSNDGLEIVFWNAFHRRNFKDLFLELGKQPDVAVLVEASENSISSLKKQFPDRYFYVWEKEEMAVFSKQPILFRFETTNQHQTSIISFETSGLQFYAVDVSASTSYFRKDELNFVKSHTRIEKSIILGDFNTPLQSVHFNSYRNDFNDALDIKGFGFMETWFWNLPILSLDHIWVSKDLSPMYAEKIKTFKSDHVILKTVIK